MDAKDWFRQRSNRLGLALFLLLFFVYMAVGQVILSREISSDLQLHADICKTMNQGKLPYSGVFLMFFLVNLFSGFSTDYFVLFYVLTAFVALAFALKGLLLFRHIHKLAGSAKGFWFSLASMFYFGIPVLYFVRNRYFYISNQTPNVFHSSSTILVCPLAIILFFLQLRYWEGKKVLGWIAILIISTAFIKPSFLMVYAVVTPFFSLYKFGLRKVFFSSLIPSVLIVLLLTVQALAIFSLQLGTVDYEKSHVVLSFFDFWTFFYPEKYFLYSVLGGFLFPICFWMLTIFEKKPISFYYAGVLVCISLLIFVFVSETGGRRFHGNFSWQITISYGVLLLVCLQEMFRLEKADLLQFWKKTILYSIFGLHVLCGLIYMYRFLILKDYN
jgi:hypothetical protein